MGVNAREVMVPEAIGRLRQADDPRVSPDGSHIAFSVSDVDLEENRYRHKVWLAPTDGDGPARPLTAGPDDQLPRWSPDGSLLAFAANAVGGPSQLCVIPVSGGGERIVIAEWPEDLNEIAWSPDSSRLAFVARDRDQETYGKPGEKRGDADTPPRRVTKLFSRLNGEGFVFDRPKRVMVVQADGSSAPLRLSTGPFEASGIAWSPDGSRICFSSARHEDWDLDQAVDLWLVDADGSGEPQCLTDTIGDYSAPSWSPDGSRIAYLVDPTPRNAPRHVRLGVLDLATRERTDITCGIDRSVGPYGYGRDPVWWGDRLIASVEDSGNIHVYSFPGDGDGKPEPLVGGERWVSSFDAAGEVLAIAVSSPTTFPEVVVRSLSNESASERRLTNLGGPFNSLVRLSEPAPYSASSRDGTEVPCWAMPPVGAEPGRRYPTLLNVHGGPFTSYGNRFFDEFQLQTGAGFGVLYCNPRGSSGYSEAWGRAVRWPECDEEPGSGWGGVDFEDVIACVDDALTRFDWIDPDRLGILGGSYGGYMTSWAIGHTHRFKAAVSERACNNLLTLENNSDIATGFRSYVGKSHLDDPGAYLRQSPITYVKEMTTPLLILHSEEDLRCPIDQAEELFVALRLLGRSPVFYRFPGESHELSRSGRPRHRVQRAEVILDWFRQHLMA